MNRLENKIALITGAAGGIGSATVRRFVAEGAKVIVADIDKTGAGKLAEELGSNAFAVTIDIGDQASVQAGMEEGTRHFGGLDILFNNAALTDQRTQSLDGDIVSTPIDVWMSTLNTNASGYMLCSRQAIPIMAASGGGCIINTASGGGMLADIARVSYGVSKAAVIALTKYIATQHGKDRVRCVAIAPGAIVTPHSRALAGPLFDMIEGHTPMRELGRPEDIAALATFLASDEARYINGETIVIDGGVMAHHAHVKEMEEMLGR